MIAKIDMRSLAVLIELKQLRRFSMTRGYMMVTIFYLNIQMDCGSQIRTGFTKFTKIWVASTTRYFEDTDDITTLENVSWTFDICVSCC